MLINGGLLPMEFRTYFGMNPYVYTNYYTLTMEGFHLLKAVDLPWLRKGPRCAWYFLSSDVLKQTGALDQNPVSSSTHLVGGSSMIQSGKVPSWVMQFFPIGSIIGQAARIRYTKWLLIRGWKVYRLVKSSQQIAWGVLIGQAAMTWYNMQNANLGAYTYLHKTHILFHMCLYKKTYICIQTKLHMCISHFIYTYIC